MVLNANSYGNSIFSSSCTETEEILATLKWCLRLQRLAPLRQRHLLGTPQKWPGDYDGVDRPSLSLLPNCPFKYSLLCSSSQPITWAPICSDADSMTASTLSRCPHTSAARYDLSKKTQNSENTEIHQHTRKRRNMVVVGGILLLSSFSFSFSSQSGTRWNTKYIKEHLRRKNGGNTTAHKG